MLFDNFCKTEDFTGFFLFLSYIFSIDLINGLKIYYIDISILNAISQKNIYGKRYKNILIFNSDLEQI